MNTKVMFSKKSDLWTTPKDIYEGFIDKGYFDPCPVNPQFDGLKITWEKLCYVNPPYSQIRVWLEKAISEVEKGNCRKAVFLVPARVDTKWFHELVYNKFNIQFIKGRLKFGEGTNSAPFPSMWIWIKK